MIEREITSPVSLTTADGRFNPESQGWTRTQLHDTSGIGQRSRGRNKRWEYWNVMTPTHIIALTVSWVDYMALHAVWMFDRTTGAAIDVTDIVPGGRSATLPPPLSAMARLERAADDCRSTSTSSGPSPAHVCVQRPRARASTSSPNVPRGMRRWGSSCRGAATVQ